MASQYSFENGEERKKRKGRGRTQGNAANELPNDPNNDEDLRNTRQHAH
jgi:hypothetical protein